MKLFTFCCNCGYKLGRSSVGTETEMVCPRCSERITYEVNNGKVTVTLMHFTQEKKEENTPA